MPIIRFMILISLIFTGAIFGFFYAWVCSTMWGLDQMNPVDAIKAMNAMNASVRNPVFFPAFFLTPIILGLTAAVCWKKGASRPAQWIAAAAALYLFGALIPTALVNVPMNEALALVSPAVSSDQATQIWSSYSIKWQNWNTARTGASGFALIFLGWAALTVKRETDSNL